MPGGLGAQEGQTPTSYVSLTPQPRQALLIQAELFQRRRHAIPVEKACCGMKFPTACPNAGCYQLKKNIPVTKPGELLGGHGFRGGLGGGWQQGCASQRSTHRHPEVTATHRRDTGCRGPARLPRAPLRRGGSAAGRTPPVSPAPAPPRSPPRPQSQCPPLPSRPGASPSPASRRPAPLPAA